MRKKGEIKRVIKEIVFSNFRDIQKGVLLMKKYKFMLVRANVLQGADRELEEVANMYSREGWEFKSAQYFEDILCFLPAFEKDD